MTLAVVYEDNHLLVVNKSPGMLTQPNGTSQENVEDLAKRWIKEKYQKKGNVFLEAAHRLDKAARGIVVFAKTSKALSRLTTAIRNRQVKKIYHAWVEGTPPSEEGLLEHYLVHDDYKARIVSEETNQAKLVRLHYRILKKERDRTLLQVDLETGRYHQIRAQLAEMGWPIVGDVKYGSQSKDWKEGIALQHFRMEIPHPITKEKLIFQAQETI